MLTHRNDIRVSSHALVRGHGGRVRQQSEVMYLYCWIRHDLLEIRFYNHWFPNVVKEYLLCWCLILRTHQRRILTNSAVVMNTTPFLSVLGERVSG